MDSTSESYSPSCRVRRWLKFQNLSIRYAETFGFRTFPLIHKRQPAIKWKVITQLRIFDTTAAMAVFDCAARKVNGLAVIVGPISNCLAVRDFDTEEGYERWRSAHPQIAARCFIVRTRRGYHVYFRLPDGHGPIYRKMPDGELLGDNKHYVPLPPSLHSDKLRYRWLDGRAPRSADDLHELDPVAAGLLPEPLNPAESENPPSSEGDDVSEPVQDSEITPHTQPPTMSLCATALTNRLQLEPNGMGQRNQCLWNLARVLKAEPAFRKLATPPEAVMSIIRNWHAKHLDHIGTKQFAETWCDFERQWGLAYSPLRSAESLPGDAPELATENLCNRYRDRQMWAILKLAARLCKGRAGVGFFLPARVVEKDTKVPYRSASRKLAQLVKDGVLELVKRHKWKGEGTKGMEYRFATPVAAYPV